MLQTSIFKVRCSRRWPEPVGTVTTCSPVNRRQFLSLFPYVGRKRRKKPRPPRASPTTLLLCLFWHTCSLEDREISGVVNPWKTSHLRGKRDFYFSFWLLPFWHPALPISLLSHALSASTVAEKLRERRISRARKEISAKELRLSIESRNRTIRISLLSGDKRRASFPPA